MIASAAAFPARSPARSAHSARRRWSWPSRASDGASARPAMAGTWRRRRPTSSTTSSRQCPFGSGSSRCTSGCGGFPETGPRPSLRWTKGNVGKQENAANSMHAEAGHATGDCCGTPAKPRSHDTLWLVWAEIMARVGERFPLQCPRCGGDIRLRGDGRQEPAHFEPEVRKRKKARMASPT